MSDYPEIDAKLRELEDRREAVHAIAESVAVCTPECAHAPGETAGRPFPGRAGYVTGECGHAVAGSEWRAGFRSCERC